MGVELWDHWLLGHDSIRWYRLWWCHSHCKTASIVGVCVVPAYRRDKSKPENTKHCYKKSGFFFLFYLVYRFFIQVFSISSNLLSFIPMKNSFFFLKFTMCTLDCSHFFYLQCLFFFISVCFFNITLKFTTCKSLFFTFTMSSLLMYNLVFILLRLTLMTLLNVLECVQGRTSHLAKIGNRPWPPPTPWGPQVELFKNYLK